MTSNVTFSIIDRIGVLRLDDGKANAVGHHTLVAIDSAIDKAESDALALLIVGREGLFCAGFDLKVMTAGTETASDLVKHGARTALRLYGASIPVVAACTGHALAFGAIMLLSCDVRIGADIKAKLGLNEVSLGMPLPVFAIELARDRLTPSHFTRATALAEVYSPKGAATAGYLDEVVAADELEATAFARAQALADYLDPTGFALTRRTARQGTIDHISSTLEESLSDFAIHS